LRTASLTFLAATPVAAIAAAPRATPATVLASLLVGTNRFAVLVTVFAALLNRFFLAMRYNVVRNLTFHTRTLKRGANQTATSIPTLRSNVRFLG